MLHRVHVELTEVDECVAVQAQHLFEDVWVLFGLLFDSVFLLLGLLAGDLDVYRFLEVALQEVALHFLYYKRGRLGERCMGGLSVGNNGRR